jgi:hypothetical protein
MKITLSPHINEEKCPVCEKRRPWPSTQAKLDSRLREHNVKWQHFLVMHGKSKTCAEALDSSGTHDRGLYIVATDPSGQLAKNVAIFARQAGYYVGLSSILDRNDAFVWRGGKKRES